MVRVRQPADFNNQKEKMKLDEEISNYWSQGPSRIQINQLETDSIQMWMLLQQKGESAGSSLTQQILTQHLRQGRKPNSNSSVAGMVYWLLVTVTYNLGMLVLVKYCRLTLQERTIPGLGIQSFQEEEGDGVTLLSEWISAFIGLRGMPSGCSNLIPRHNNFHRLWGVTWGKRIGNGRGELWQWIRPSTSSQSVPLKSCKTI